MEKKIKAVVLAAGKSTRMMSARSKVVHQILGKEIINFLLDSLCACGVREEDIAVVVGDNRPEVEQAVKRRVHYAPQYPQLGTAHALLAARDFAESHAGELLVLVGDNPYITEEELKRLIDHHRKKKASCTIISALFPFKPPPYGRVIRDARGTVIDVVEELDATEEQLKICEVNSSIYMFDNPVVFPRLGRIQNHNAKKEYYLTDIIRILIRDGFRVEAIPAADYHISIGINTRWELQEAQRILGETILKNLALEHGVTILQPESVTVELGVTIGPDTVIYPCTYIGSGTRIGKNCSIGPFAWLHGVQIPDGQAVAFTQMVNPTKRNKTLSVS